MVKINDTPATILWVDEGAIGTYEGACPDCEVPVIETNNGQLSQLPSLVSSVLTSSPDIGYVHVAFDVAVQPTIQGIQSADLGPDETALVSQDGTLPVMQNLANGQFVSAAVGFNQEALAWYGADQVLRMMSGQDSVQSLDFPYRRLFTSDVVADLDITEEARGTGTWFGDTTYTPASWSCTAHADPTRRPTLSGPSSPRGAGHGQGRASRRPSHPPLARLNSEEFPDKKGPSRIAVTQRDKRLPRQPAMVTEGKKYTRSTHRNEGPMRRENRPEMMIQGGQAQWR